MATRTIQKEAMEVVAKMQPLPTVIKDSVEVIASSTKIPVVQREILEIVARHAKIPIIQKELLEILGSAERLTTGFQLPGIGVSSFTLFMFLSPVNWGLNSNHQFTMTTGQPNIGLFLNQSATTANRMELLFHTGNGFLTATIDKPNINANFIFAMRFDTANAVTQIHLGDNLFDNISQTGQFDSGVAFAYLCGLLQTDKKINGNLAEVILYNSLLTDFHYTQVQNYLSCKWISPGPNESNNFCIPN